MSSLLPAPLPTEVAAAVALDRTAALIVDQRVGTIRRVLIRVAMAPAAVYAAFLSTTVAGVVGSQSDKILSAFPFALGSGPISWHAVVFWLLGGISTTLAYIKEDETRRVQLLSDGERQASDTAALEARAATLRATNQLAAEVAETRVQLINLPTSDLLVFFDSFTRMAHQAHVAAVRTGTRPSGKDAETVLGLIRVVLFAVASLVQKFDQSPAGVTFSANVMLYRPQRELRGRRKVALQQRLRFVDSPTVLPALRGVLDMQCALSVRFDANAGVETMQPDAGLRPMAMPVPVTSETLEQGWIVLPGAPQAFCSGQMDVCQNVDQIIERCDSRFVHKHLSRQIKNHLADDVQHIRSFLSVPLFRSSNPNGEPVGVLNINSSRSSLVADVKAQELLYSLVRPMLWLLPDMIDLLDNARNSSLMEATVTAPVTP